ncbi:hypothetical protein GXW82_32695 [Streptacidiphilus sp. 4-A2]|nr:hypothetical protein [Streptacidiphilus sp. 4-A2]
MDSAPYLQAEDAPDYERILEELLQNDGIRQALRRAPGGPGPRICTPAPCVTPPTSPPGPRPSTPTTARSATSCAAPPPGPSPTASAATTRPSGRPRTTRWTPPSGPAGCR